MKKIKKQDEIFTPKKRSKTVVEKIVDAVEKLKSMVVRIEYRL